MISHPTASELLDSVIGFIEKNCAPQLKDRDVFLARVAVNALNTVKREIETGAAAEAASLHRLGDLLDRDGDLETLNAELCRRLGGGELDAGSPGVLAHLKADLVDRVGIDQPQYSGLKAAREAG